MATIPGSVPVTGLIAPTDTTDTFPVTDPKYGIDGLRSVANIAERNAIPAARRREGMLVYVQFDQKYWRLNASPWNNSDSDWVEFSSGGGGGTGPQGPQGPQGPAGNSTTYIHTQDTPATTWTINHNLGRYPSITVVDSSGYQFIGSTQYISDNQIQVEFSAGFSGKAYLN